jgi:hypothetical protein
MALPPAFDTLGAPFAAIDMSDRVLDEPLKLLNDKSPRKPQHWP